MHAMQNDRKKANPIMNASTRNERKMMDSHLRSCQLRLIKLPHPNYTKSMIQGI